MIIGDNKDQVIDNIRKAIENKSFNSKVEIDDPVLEKEKRQEMLRHYLKNRSKIMFHLNNRLARLITDVMTRRINRSTKITGLEHATGIHGGAIITSNHFNPIDNTIIRSFVHKRHGKRLYIVSQETNLMMSGFIGYLMNYADTIPLSPDHHYMKKHFEPMLGDALLNGNYVLIYPEQEMWFNYRKPRPLKHGAYHYAIRFGVPILSCFVEMTDLAEMDEKGFKQVQYTLHILPPIYPDPQKTERENRLEMCRQDYQQKKAAYEAAYQKVLDYNFNLYDIAGWIPSDLERCT